MGNHTETAESLLPDLKHKRPSRYLSVLDRPLMVFAGLLIALLQLIQPVWGITVERKPVRDVPWAEELPDENVDTDRPVSSSPADYIKRQPPHHLLNFTPTLREHLPNPAALDTTNTLVQKHISAADQYFLQGDWNSAITEIESATDLNPKTMTLQLVLGELYNRTGRYADAIAAADRVLRAVPRSVQAYDIRGTAYLRLGRTGESIADFEQVIAKAPDKPVGYYHLGYALFLSNSYDDALKNFSNALKQQPDLTDAMLISAVILLERGQNQEAVAMGERLLKIDPDHAFIHSVMGSAYYALELFDRSEQEYRAAASLRPDIIYFKEQLARGYVQRNRIADAIAIYRQVLVSAPAHGRAHRALAELYQRSDQIALAEYHLGFLAWRNDDIAASLQHYRAAVTRDPELKGAYLDMAAIHLRARAPRQAARMAERAITIDPRDAMARDLLAQAFRDEGRTGDALELFRIAIDLEPAYIPALLHAADLMKDSGDCERAAPGYRQVIAMDPATGHAFAGLGDCFLATGQPQQAIDAYRKAIERLPRDADVLNSLAVLYSKRGTDLIEAQRLAEYAAQQRPSDPAIIDTLGWIYYLNGHTRAAIQNLEIAAQALPDEATVLYHLGAAYSRDKQFSQAEDILKQVVISGQSFPEADQAKSLLNQLTTNKNL